MNKEPRTEYNTPSEQEDLKTPLMGSYALRGTPDGIRDPKPTQLVSMPDSDARIVVHDTVNGVDRTYYEF